MGARDSGDAPLTVPVHYDFSSSLCYVAHRVLGRLGTDLERLRVAVRWTPLDLTRLSPWRPGAPIRGPRRENALRVARELEVAIRLPTHWMDSRPAMAVALALEGTAREPAWRERVWSAVYEEGRSLDEAGILERMGRDLGLDTAGLLTPERLQALQQRTKLAARARVTSVPTFMLDEWPMAGIQTEETMRSLLGRFVERKRRELH